jgi:hypothetical protein
LTARRLLLGYRPFGGTQTASIYPGNRNKTALVCSGAARLVGAWGEKTQWPPVTEIMGFRKPQLFIGFPYMWLSNLKFYEPRKVFFFTDNSHIPPIFAGSWCLFEVWIRSCIQDTIEYTAHG